MNKEKVCFLTKMDINSFSVVSDERLDKIYNTYLLENKNREYFVLKKATDKEIAINQLLIKHGFIDLIPEIMSFSKELDSNHKWMTTRYVGKKDLSRLNQSTAKLLGKHLAKLTNYFYFEEDLLNQLTPNTDEQLAHKLAILDKLDKNSILYDSCNLYINRFISTPKTLCHDDLLPINVLQNQTTNQLKIIDWEHTRKGNYTTDIARFSAFYTTNQETFEKGLSFYGCQSDIDLLLCTYYSLLDAQIKEQVSKQQFLEDYHLEALNQLIMTISYLKKINTTYIQTEWENYFFTLALEKAIYIKKEHFK
ncbi:phosphotransferase [Vagococcus sp.]|uniref:phosphotransferase n=1 Tax=Vagococcus sp. TaxID=1933889 RepID=UPI002FC884EE